MKVFDFQPNFP